MAKIQIIAEGKSDKKFLQDYIKHIFNDTLNITFETLGGIDKDISVIKKAPIIIQKMQESTNLLIIDANGNFEKRIRDASEIAQDLNIQFELFLFPNHKDNGNLETLLCEIINQKHKAIFDCFDSYCACLKSGSYRSPGEKSKVFAYLETLYKDESDKRLQYEFRDYLNPDHWNLSHSYLGPLKDFLLRNITL